MVLSRGGGPVQGGDVHPPPPFSDRMTDACENITFARFATRAVTRGETN